MTVSNTSESRNGELTAPARSRRRSGRQFQYRKIPLTNNMEPLNVK
jgi:hypothetical protein